MWSHERYYQNAWRPEAAWGHQQGGWGHELAWGRSYAPWGRSYVGASLDDGILKDTLEAKKQADTLYTISQPIWIHAFVNKSNWQNAIEAATATVNAYRHAREVVAPVLTGPDVVPNAKFYAKKYDDQFVARITSLTAIIDALGNRTAPAIDLDIPGNKSPISDAVSSPMAMMAITVLAFAGGGALVGWLILHSQKAALIGGGIGLAAGAVSQAAASGAAAP